VLIDDLLLSKCYSFSKHNCNVIFSEAEVIKEKVKPAPVKKGMDVKQIILRIPLELI